MNEIRLGIDFGTTTTSVAMKVGNQMPIALPIGEDGVRTYIPSVVLFRPGYEHPFEGAIVGEEAERNPSRSFVVHSIKRCIGCEGDKCTDPYKRGLHEVLGTNPQKRGLLWCRGDGQAHIPDVGVFNPEDIAYLIVKEAFRRAIEAAWVRHQVDLKSAMVSLIPTNFGCGVDFDYSNRKKLLTSVAHELGLNQVSLENIVEEPILAGLAIVRYMPNLAGRVLVYDFGGGTFDVAILDVRETPEGPHITVLGSKGKSWLGGDDIDILVSNHIVGQIAASEGLEPEDIRQGLEPIDIWHLRMMSKNAKERLSEIEVFQDVLFTEEFGTQTVSLTREELESLVQSKSSNLIQEANATTEYACRLVYALDTAKNAPLLDVSRASSLSLLEAAKWIDYVLPVGGVTHMPIIRNKLKSIFGEHKIIDPVVIDPIEAVCLGGSYDKDLEHFSIAYPPYSIQMKLVKPGGETEIRNLTEPFMHLNFFMRCPIVSSGDYLGDFFIEDDMEASIGIRYVSDTEASFKDIGILQTGMYKLHIFLDGRIRILNDRGENRCREYIPIKYLHPSQIAIREERARRSKEEARRWKSQEEDWISWFTEN